MRAQALVDQREVILTFSSQKHSALLNVHLLIHFRKLSGDEGIRTPDLRRAKAALSQLSYIPVIFPREVGLSGLEPETLPLSEARSNQLS